MRRDRIYTLCSVGTIHILLLAAALQLTYGRATSAPQAVHELKVTMLSEVRPEAKIPTLPLPKPMSPSIPIVPLPLPDIQAPPPPLPVQVAGNPITLPPSKADVHIDERLEKAHESAEKIDAPPSADASAKGNPKPVYPAISRKLGEEGQVLLEVYVLADGTVGDIRVQKTSGYGRLDQSALNAVRRWVFSPARKSGQAVAMWYVQPIGFNLHNA